MAKFDKPRPRWLKLGLALCLIVIIIGAVIVGQILADHAAGKAAYEQIRQEADARDTLPTETAPETAPTETVSRSALDFIALKESARDIVAWLYCEGNNIDYPVVRTNDNDYYLNHLYDGTKNKAGALFVDYRNKGDFSERNTAIYGHHMSNGTMFQNLIKYKELGYYEKCPRMVLYTPEGDYWVELFAATIEDANEDFILMEFETEADFLAYAADLKARSVFKSDVEAVEGDRLLTLCTCTYEYDNARFCVYGRLVPAGQ